MGKYASETNVLNECMRVVSRQTRTFLTMPEEESSLRRVRPTETLQIR